MMALRFQMEVCVCETSDIPSLPLGEGAGWTTTLIVTCIMLFFLGGGGGGMAKSHSWLLVSLYHGCVCVCVCVGGGGGGGSDTL